MIRLKAQIASDIDEYIDGFPTDTRKRMQSIRAAIHDAAPGVEETIKYAMPTFVLHGNLVYFAACKSHIGFYGIPTDSSFEKAYAPYKTGRGSIQFPFDMPVPLKLIIRIVKFRVKQNLEKQKAKQQKKSE